MSAMKKSNAPADSVPQAHLSGGVAAFFNGDKSVALEQGAHYVARDAEQVGSMDLIAVTEAEGLADDKFFQILEMQCLWSCKHSP